MPNTVGNSYFMVFSNPVEGKEAEYNDWYTNIHLAEVVGLDGVLSAQRFCLSEAQMVNEQPYKYTAIYEVEKGMEAAVLSNLETAATHFNMQPVLDEKLHAQMVGAITDVVVSS